MPMSDHIRKPAPHPLLVIAKAITWARAAGHHIRFGSFGVHCTSRLTAERWELDPRVGALDPIGAAILHAQPQATDPYEAAAEALNAPLPWVIGFQEQIDDEQPSRRWNEPVQRALYAAGQEAGARFMLVYRQRTRTVH